MFQMLAEVVGTEEFLRLVAFPELVNLGKMTAACVPVWLWKILEFVSAIPTNLRVGDSVRGGELAVRVVGEDGCRRVEGSLVIVGQSCTGPRVLAEVKRILMPFSLVLILKFVVAPLTRVLFFGLVNPVG